MRLYWSWDSRHVGRASKDRWWLGCLVEQILEVLDLSIHLKKMIQSLESLSGYEHRLEDLELG